jgi:hypothetical protein
MQSIINPNLALAFIYSVYFKNSSKIVVSNSGLL